MAYRLTAQVRDIALVTTAVAKGDLSRKVTVHVAGEMLELKNTVNTMVDQLSSFSSEVTRVAREVGTEGELGGQAQVPGVAGVWKDLTDSVNLMAGQPHRPGARDRPGHHGGRQRRPVAEDHRERARRGRAARRDDQHDDRDAAHLRRRGDAGGQRGRRRGPAGRSGAGAGCGGYVEGPHRLGEHRVPQPHRAGAGHRAGDDGGGERRPVAEGHRRRLRRDAGAEEHRQHDGRPAVRPSVPR